ncbi:MAG: alpha/beta hydrolase [Verrucomicrobiota bacterium]
MKRLSVICGLVTLWAIAGSAQDMTKVKPNMTEGVEAMGSFIFTYVDDKKRRRLTLEMYRPAEITEPRPAIVFYFGGGWQNGRPGLFAPMAQALAQRGYITVLPEYRLSGEAEFPAAVNDAKAAVRWTRKNAKRFKIDPDRIACMGGSAGGHLSGFVAATSETGGFEGEGEHQDVSSAVQAAVVMCGPMDLLAPDVVEKIEQSAKGKAAHPAIPFLGGLPSTHEEVYRQASPVTHVSAHTPPMLFIDGEKDRPRERYTTFWPLLEKHGVPYEFVMMPQAPHPFWNNREWFLPTVEAVEGFLKKHLP